MKAGVPTGRAGSLVIELGTGTAVVDGQRIEIPRGEFELLAALAARRGEAVTSKDLLEELWPGDSVTTEVDLRTRVYKLRKRIGDHGRDHKLVANRPGFGYLIDLPPGAIKVVSRTDAIPNEPESQVIVLEDQSDESIVAATKQAPTTDDARAVGVAHEVALAGHEGQMPSAPLIRPLVVGLAVLVTSALLTGSWLAGSWLSQRRSPVARVPNVGGEQTDETGPERKRPDKADRSTDQGSRSDKAGRQSRATTPQQTTVAAGSQSTEADPDEGPRGTSADRKAPPSVPQPDVRLFHLYDPDSGNHFMTTDSSEANQRQAAGQILTMEGRVFETRSGGTTPISIDGSTAYIYRDANSAPQSVDVAPLYRLTKSTDAFFTSSSSQANQAEAQGWTRSLAGYVGT